MVISYDVDKINAFLDDFYKATDINVNLLKPDFSLVGGKEFRENNHYCQAVRSTKEGIKGCKYSDEAVLQECRKTKKMKMRICHAGLWDVAAPILYNDDVIIGYIIFGEMKDSPDFSKYADYLSSLGLDASLLEKYYEDVKLYDKDKIRSVGNIAGVLVKYILCENMLKLDLDQNIEKAVAYINDNLAADLSVQTIARNIHISKSVLYKRFRANFDCTVNEYINARRIEKAIDLLTKTNLSIEDVSKKTGFTSASYFSKTFKKLKGVSPLQYKKQS